MTLLRDVPPMGIYETLYAFQRAFGSAMGEPGTHPWSQGYPRTTQLPGGPPIPTSVAVPSAHLKYPKAWGLPALREAIAAYYRRHYGSDIVAENVMVFAGGRPALIAVLLLLNPDWTVRVAETEYTPYYDMLERLGRRYALVESGTANAFRPDADAYFPAGEGPTLALLSNPCNPTGVTRDGAELEALVTAARQNGRAVLVDEAYELFHEPPVSALRFVRNIDDSNVVVVGAATKGLQAPGIRIGWAVAARKTVEVLGNFSSFGMGGVSHLSQEFARILLEEDRVALARRAVPVFYRAQRDRYGEALVKLGLALHSGNGGFYHWCRLPGALTAAELNHRLYRAGAAVLEGTLCDMARRGNASPLRQFFRFSFGPLEPSSFDADVVILRRALEG